MNSQCTFCTYNCSADTDFCTVEPCNITTGCSIFDCANDGNPCTLNPCNSTLGGCTPLDCQTDGDFCSIGTCDPANGGCAIRNCTAIGDPCLADPCINGACAYQCPVLQLVRKLTKFLVICDNNFHFFVAPQVNLTTTLIGVVTNVNIVPNLALYSVPNVRSATVRTFESNSNPINTFTGYDSKPASWFCLERDASSNWRMGCHLHPPHPYHHRACAFSGHPVPEHLAVASVLGHHHCHKDCSLPVPGHQR